MLQVVGNLELTAIVDARSVPNVIHGTYMKYWPQIKQIGLSRMRRVHIHFACSLPGDPNVKSGIRRDAEVFIYIDLQKALEAGLSFFKSSNGVILSPGDIDGLIKPSFFTRVCTVDSKSNISAFISV